MSVLQAGIKIKASEKIGFELQARLLMPIFYAGANFRLVSNRGGEHECFCHQCCFSGSFYSRNGICDKIALNCHLRFACHLPSRHLAFGRHYMLRPSFNGHLAFGSHLACGRH